MVEAEGDSVLNRLISFLDVKVYLIHLGPQHACLFIYLGNSFNDKSCCYRDVSLGREEMKHGRRAGWPGMPYYGPQVPPRLLEQVLTWCPGQGWTLR